ncbi:MAG: TIGR03936 family radical SAM-associated protein [Elusimicrobiota bacterium]
MKAIARIRVKYAKKQTLRFLSHIEVVSAIRQAVRRANLPVCTSFGFSPQLKISFGPPLPVGYTSTCELFDIEMSRRVLPEDIHKVLSDNLPAGFEVISISSVPVITKPIELLVNVAKYSVEMIWQRETGEIKINEFFATKEFLIERLTDKSKRIIDVRPLVINMKQTDNILEMILRFGPKKTAKPDVIIQKMFGLSNEQKLTLRINRDKFFCEMETGSLRDI